MDCPACGFSQLRSVQKVMRIPHFGEILISTLTCSKCGYRNTDVMPTTTKPPKRYILKVFNLTDLNTRIIRSGSSTLNIPELGVKIDPVTNGEGYITNIEGLLYRILDIVKHMRKDIKEQIEDKSDEDPDLLVRMQRAEDLILRINSIIKSGGEFTVILEDPYGNSAIVSDREGALEVEDLKPEEISLMIDGTT